MELLSGRLSNCKWNDGALIQSNLELIIKSESQFKPWPSLYLSKSISSHLFRSFELLHHHSHRHHPFHLHRWVLFQPFWLLLHAFYLWPLSNGFEISGYRDGTGTVKSVVIANRLVWKRMVQFKRKPRVEHETLFRTKNVHFDIKIEAKLT